MASPGRIPSLFSVTSQSERRFARGVHGRSKKLCLLSGQSFSRWMVVVGIAAGGGDACRARFSKIRAERSAIAMPEMPAVPDRGDSGNKVIDSPSIVTAGSAIELALAFEVEGRSEQLIGDSRGEAQRWAAAR